MDTEPIYSGKRFSYTFDAILEDEETQEVLNRLRRKPGEPGYCPPPSQKRAEPPQPEPPPPSEPQKE